MVMIACPACRNDVSTDATACPHCGTPRPGEKQTVFRVKILSDASLDDIKAHINKVLSPHLKDFIPDDLTARYTKIQINTLSDQQHEVIVELSKVAKSNKKKFQRLAITTSLLIIANIVFGVIGVLIVGLLSIMAQVVEIKGEGPEPEEIRNALDELSGHFEGKSTPTQAKIAEPEG